VQEKVGRRQVVTAPPQNTLGNAQPTPGRSPNPAPVQTAVNGASHVTVISDKSSSEANIDTTPVRPKAPVSAASNSSTQGKGIIDRVREFFKDFF